MPIRIQHAYEHNLLGVDVEIGSGLTVVTGVSGSGKTSLVFDTLYHEAQRRFTDIYALGSTVNRLAPANVESITGLGSAVAVGQNLLNRNPNSILATAAGLHPFFRLLYTHYGVRTCAKCHTSINVYTDDETITRLAAKVLHGPVQIWVPLLHMVPGSHRTLLAALSEKYGINALQVDGFSWQGEPLDPTKPHELNLYLGTLEDPSTSSHTIRQLLKGSSSLGSQAIKVQWDNGQEILSRAPVCSTCGTWFGELKPIHFNTVCPHCQGQGCSICDGTGLPPQAAAVRWEGLRLPDLLVLSVDETWQLFAGNGIQPEYSQMFQPLGPESGRRLWTEITRRLESLQRVGLGYLTLNRPSPTLSRGEAQRVRLALTLISRLEDMLHILDEPTIGQHPSDVKRLLPAFRELKGPVVFVEHDRLAAAEADWAIDLGPGAGNQGGRITFSGTPEQLWKADTPTGRYFSNRARPRYQPLRPAPKRFLSIRGANMHNLQDIDITIPLGCLTMITGVSGSGKSTLVEDVLVASLILGKPVGCLSIEGVLLKPVMVDQSPIGRNPRSNPATYTKLADILRDLYAVVTGLSPSQFSFNRPEGACPSCNGLGAVEIPMRYLPSTWVTCPDCDGQRFNEKVLSVKVSFGKRSLLHLSIADFLTLSVDEATQIFLIEERLSPPNRLAAIRILEALRDIGLGYLSLGQPSPTLSGGEAQRVKLARYLGLKSLSQQLLILDEPSTGLHPQDLSGLLTVLDRLTCSGATIVVVEHNTDMLRAADWVIDLGPGAGPEGGRLLYTGALAGLKNVTESPTGRVLDEEDRNLNRASPLTNPENGHKLDLATRERSLLHPSISIRGARTNNLQNVNVDIPKGKLTVVTGISGSGKSSLVSDVLETEAHRRFLETLSLYERQGTHEGAEADVDSITGLGVALTIGSERLVYSRRATIGTATELAYHLAALLSAVGQRACLQCGSPSQMRRTLDHWICPDCQVTAPIAKPRHFSSSTYAAACIKCNGVGSTQVPQPHKLIIHPEKPLCDGAMYSPGFFPNGYLGKHFNGGYYLVQALAQRYGFDPMITPWNEMTEASQQAFLFGTDELLQVTAHSRTGRISSYEAKFPGFYGFIRDWDVGGTYTGTVPCSSCQGARLRPEYLAVTLAGHNVHQLNQMTLQDLVLVFEEIQNKNTIIPSVTNNSLRTILQRINFLIQVGLGYIDLGRVAGTLSAGEAQRIRLASLLGSGLTSLTLLLDEPTRGLHPTEVEALLKALFTLRDEGNTVIVVEHDPLIIRSADYLVDMGPGAGQNGGQVIAQGTPKQVAECDSLTALWLRGERSPFVGPDRGLPKQWLTIRGARANNLHGESLSIPLARVVGICGVSGSGKSTLIIDTLGRALAHKKQTTSVAYEPIDPGDYDNIDGAPTRTLLIDQSRAGLSNPASFLGLISPLRSLFAESEDAQIMGVNEEQLTERCAACGGSGAIFMDMAFLPAVRVTCETCQGSGHLPEAWQVHLRGVSLPDVYRMTLDQVYDLFGDFERMVQPLWIARSVGLGYLVFRQPGYTLSGGEAQRLKIAQELCRKTPQDTLYILDEPTVGQHLEDVQRLIVVLHRLVNDGGSVVVVEHHPHLLAACDWLVELGPGGGPNGGHVIACGPPAGLAAGHTPTAPFLREILEAIA